MDNPLFSIVIPAYNAASTLEETLDSVSAQQFDSWECLVIDDGSVDETRAIVEGYAHRDARFRVLSQPNAGIAAAYNTGIAHARGTWIVMLSADDLLMPSHLERYAEAIENHHDRSLVSSNGFYLFDDGNMAPAYGEGSWLEGDECTLSDLFDRCFFSMGTAFTTEAAQHVGGFRSGVYAEDYGFFLDLLADGFRHHYIDEPLAIHRRNRRQRSADGLAMRRADLATIDRIAQAYELTDEQKRAYQAARARITKNIRRRKLLYRFLGPHTAERLIEGIRRA